MLTVTNLSYKYGTQTVLSDLSLHLPAERIALLVGRNGAGKSTLLRALAGWSQSSGGTIEIEGISLQTEERQFRRRVIFVPDTPDFYDELTAWEHLQLTAQLHRLAEWQDQAGLLLRDFQLYDHRDALPFTFSRGMRYKLALCLALLISPRLLLLDEPFGPLDARAARRLWQALQRFRAEGKSVLLSSHTIPEGERADSVLLLRDQQVMLVPPAMTTDLGALFGHG